MLKMTWQQECEVGSTIVNLIGGIDLLNSLGVKFLTHTIQTRTTTMSVTIGFKTTRITIVLTDVDQFSVKFEDYTDNPWPAYRHLKTVKNVTAANLASVLAENTGLSFVNTVPATPVDPVNATADAQCGYRPLSAALNNPISRAAFAAKNCMPKFVAR